jgi:hypothetical protein
MKKLQDLGTFIAIFIMFAIVSMTIIILLIWVLEPEFLMELLDN